MKKFGLSSKKDKTGSSEYPAPAPAPATAGEDSKRSHLFGGRSKSSKSSSPAPAISNPYAAPQNQPVFDPYAAKPAPSIASGYTGRGSPAYPDSGRTSLASGPPAYDKPGYGGSGGMPDARMRSEKSPVPPGGYGGGAPRFANQGYGGQGGYGNDRFGGSNGNDQRQAGGYGGVGAPADPADDPRRNELFGGAKDRLKERQQQGLPPEDSQAGGGYGQSGVDSGAGDDAYAPYRERQLTAEEEEEEDVQASKDQIRALKREDVSSTRNALRIAAQAEETGRATLERLGAQGERIHNTERNLDMASNQNRLAEEKARELKHLNRSMWAMKVDNPFTKTKHKNERDEAIMDNHRKERERRDATRAAAWESQSRQEQTARGLRETPGGGLATKKGNLAERSKYQFEADSEDEAMEDEIDQNLEQLHGAAGRLNKLGRAMGQEVDVQNKHIDRIAGKTDQVDDQIAMNRARLDRIH